MRVCRALLGLLAVASLSSCGQNEAKVVGQPHLPEEADGNMSKRAEGNMHLVVVQQLCHKGGTNPAIVSPLPSRAPQ